VTILRSLFVAILLLDWGIGAASAETEQRVALVIGNGNYLSVGKLKNPANDAKAMAAMLGRLGFEVVEREDVTRHAMIQAARTFAAKLSPGGIGLFFYAGHGIQAEGANYLVPVDAALAVEDDLKYEAFDVQDVLNKLDDARVRLSLVILDACRDNPFAKSFRSSTRGLAQVDPPRGMLIAYATAPGKVAADGDGNNSVYTNELLKAMHEPGRKLQEVFDRVADAVEMQTKNAQTPWTNSSFRGDFYFIGPTTLTITVPPNQPSISIEAQEQAAWTAVASSLTSGPFEAFLKRFPSGVFADIARAKIKELKTTKQQAMVSVPPVTAASPEIPPVKRSPQAYQTPTSWPSFQASLTVAATTSAIKAELPADLKITPPGKDVPAQIRGLSGRWIGWQGKNAVVSTQVAVTRLGSADGEISYAIASSEKKVSPQVFLIPVTLINGNELQGTVPSGVVTIRQRSDGTMDVLFRSTEDTSWSSGVLSKLP